MSPLTKVFVVLLVVLSMLLSAATIVFVNADITNKAKNESLLAQRNNELKRANELRVEADAARQIAQDNAQSQMQANEQLRQQLNNLQAQLVDRATQLAQAQSQLAMQSADITRLTEALKASETTKASQTTQIVELRKTNDERLSQNTQLNQTVSDLTNRLEVTERERRELAEQLTEARGQRDQMSDQMRGLGLSTQQMMAAGTRVGPPINGVIRTVRPISGIPYATISVGSNDGVKKGMEFKVVSPSSGDFLGVLTVESVEMTEATGRLAGPKVAEIRSGAEVKTQLGA